MVNGSNIISQQLKAIENPNIIDIKSVTMERPKTFHNLYKTIRQTKKILVLYVVKQKNLKIFLMKQKL